jgi:hypothetical protein
MRHSSFSSGASVWSDGPNALATGLEGRVLESFDLEQFDASLRELAALLAARQRADGRAPAGRR